MAYDMMNPKAQDKLRACLKAKQLAKSAFDVSGDAFSARSSIEEILRAAGLTDTDITRYFLVINLGRASQGEAFDEKSFTDRTIAYFKAVKLNPMIGKACPPPSIPLTALKFSDTAKAKKGKRQ
ncbi:hypothetical protein [Azospirillum argentinense]